MTDTTYYNTSSCSTMEALEEFDYDDFLGMVDQMIAIKQGWGMGLKPVDKTFETISIKIMDFEYDDGAG